MRKREQDKGQKRAVFTPPRAGIPSFFSLPFLSIPLRYFRSFVASLRSHCAVHVPRFSSTPRRTTLDGRFETRDAPFDATWHTCVHVCACIERRTLAAIEKRGKRMRKGTRTCEGPSEAGHEFERGQNWMKIREVRGWNLKRLKVQNSVSNFINFVEFIQFKIHI